MSSEGFAPLSIKDKLTTSLKRFSKMFGHLIDDALRICCTLICSDALYRLFLCFSEYKFSINRYVSPHRVLGIFRRCFSYPPDWLIYMGLVGLVLLLRISATGMNPIVLRDFMYMPLCWIQQYLHLSSRHSKLDYAKWIRSPYGLDYGEGMASNYFHGYLKLAMPSHTSASDRGIRERIELYCSQHEVEFIIDRLVILIPNMLYVPPKIESRILEKVRPLEPVYKHRAGVHRPFKNDVYRFTEKIHGKTFYIAMEGATPLLSFYEAMHSNYTSSWQMREMQREVLFKFAQSIKKMVNEYPGTRNDVEIIFYNAHTGDNKFQDVGEVVKAHFEKVFDQRRND